MYSRDHAVVSVLVGALGVAFLSLPIPWWVAVPLAVGLGVGIDLDHFLMSRLHTGDWRAVKRGLDRPSRFVFDQDELFGPTDLWPLQRLLSHHVIGGLLVGGLWPWSEPLALFAGLVLYAHVLSDLVWDNNKLGEYHRLAAAAVEVEGAASAEREG